MLRMMMIAIPTPTREYEIPALMATDGIEQ